MHTLNSTGATPAYPAAPARAPTARTALTLLILAALGACGGGDADADVEGGAVNPPAASAPVTSDPVVNDPVVSDPVVSDPVVSPPVASSPSPSPSLPSSSSPATPSRPSSSATACDTATGRVLRVGPGKTYATPSAAAAVAQAGDVIRIAAGDYRGDVAAWNASGLTICGDGGRARLFADGRHSQGKAIWVISGANTTVDSVEFHRAAVPDRNGAGIRAQHTSGYLRIINSGFYDNENGILSAPGATTIRVERSEFARNGRGDGYTHNLYIGRIDRLEVSASYFHEAKVGSNLKSRARESVVENNHFQDGSAGSASYQADFSNGGKVLLRGNLFYKGPNAVNSNMIAFGPEGLLHSVNTLEVVHNTLVTQRPRGSFFLAAAGTASIRLTANLFAGTGEQALVAGGFASGNAAQAGNVFSLAGNIPGATRINNPNFWPNAALQALIPLTGVADAGYVRDAPAPFVLRALPAGGARKAGALQSAP